MKIKKRIILIAAAIIIVIVVVLVFFWRPKPALDGVRTVTVVKADVNQEVSFSGRLEAVQIAELSFGNGGQVKSVQVDVGDQVAAGQELIVIDDRAVKFGLAGANADLAHAQSAARLSWQAAQQARDNQGAENALAVEASKQKVRDAKTEADQAITIWQANESDSGKDSAATRTAYAAYLAKQTAYNAAQDTLATLKKTVTADGDTNAATEAIAEENYLATISASHDQAGLSSLGAQQAMRRISVADTVMIAPFAAVVTDVAIRTNEYAGAAQSLITIQTVDSLEVVASVTETDVYRLEEGLPATVSFDVTAVKNEWPAVVTSIAPAAVIIEGVPSFVVKLALDQPDSKLRPGFTANIIVQAATKKDVIAIPRRAVITQTGRSYVQLLNKDGEIVERDVETGLVGSDSLIEIISGLEPGEQIVVGG